MAGHLIAGSGYITQHFRITEFACGSYIYMDPDFITFVQCLERFRVWYNRPININSGYRTYAKNKQVGGDIDSLHLFARAVDFNFPKEWNTYTPARKKQFVTNIKNKWFAICKDAGAFGQITYHKSGWIHLAMSLNREYYGEKD